MDLPERLLMGSGPSTVPARILEAMAAPTIGHLDPAFLALTDEANELLRRAMRTENAATFPVSGTGSAGMEAMLVNFLEPGDRLVVGVCGIFGARIADAAGRLGAEVVRVDAEPGTAVDRDALAAALEPGAAALAIVHGETSTGVAQPLEGLAELVRERDALLLVDCVTSLAGYPLAVDELGIDVAFSGTQKCLNCPPGLAPLTVGDRARERLGARATKVASWCFDLEAILAYWAAGERVYHHTPPVNTIYALREALAIVDEEGLEPRWRRHERAADALLAGLAELGIEPLVAPARRLNALTTVVPGERIDEAAVRGRLLEEDGIEISGGLGPLKGRVWRIGTMGVNADIGPVARLVGAIAAIVEPDAAGEAERRVAESWSAGDLGERLVAEGA
ncbi:MAG: alanine-glyoxylate transaminase / serine-glyoxylate transaminase / serine-pyruvate transaminase [Solirubrobacterales bacterium]|jgi:alanine-glyoxylate transaminase/serine-glyoxylate transaminase/serine-pyruvate transaminase|nr:alanine-glyoxylate transaminase / serine-glyoxylate transaminase / serine-pyruvate transaminase [Solirubrobacterales bacterium]